MSFEVGNIFLNSQSNPSDAILRSPTVIISFIGLWGANVFIFKQQKLMESIAPLLWHPGDHSNKGDEIGHARKTSSDLSIEHKNSVSGGSSSDNLELEMTTINSSKVESNRNR